MATKKGGYLIIDVLALTYSIALESLRCDKPLLIINDSTYTPYYADGVEIDGSENVIIHKGGRTISVAPDGTITATGSIAPSVSAELYEHSLSFYNDGNGYCVIMTLFTNDENAITKTTLASILTNIGAISGSKVLNCGYGHAAGAKQDWVFVYVSGGQLKINNNASIDETWDFDDLSGFQDLVIKLI